MSEQALSKMTLEEHRIRALGILNTLLDGNVGDPQIMTVNTSLLGELRFLLEALVAAL
jgi:hypothetical protein